MTLVPIIIPRIFNSPHMASTQTETTNMASDARKEVRDWDLRADVLYHFHANRYLSQHYPDTSIDLVNLYEGDVHCFNRNSDIVRGLRDDHKLAAYLANFSLNHPVEAADTHRKRLLWHVREYNIRTEHRRRFYIVGASEEEALFLKSLLVQTLFDIKSRGIAGGEAEDTELEGGAKGDVKDDTKENTREDSKDKNDDTVDTIGEKVNEIDLGIINTIRPLAIAQGVKNLVATATQSYTIPAFAHSSTSHEDRHLAWATDGCPRTFFRKKGELAEQEKRVEESIEGSLRKYREKKAEGEKSGENIITLRGSEE